MDEPDFVELDRRAVAESVRVVSHVTSADLGRQTPCAEWDLSALLAHMTVQHLGFAAAARGQGADLEVWQVRPLEDDPVSAYRRAADGVVAAFAADGALDREFVLPEITLATAFPAWQAISFHFIDYVTHAWDVARAIDVELQLDAGVISAALSVAQRVPDGDERKLPGAAFRPSLPLPVGATTLDQLLRLLGRSPGWPG